MRAGRKDAPAEVKDGIKSELKDGSELQPPAIEGRLTAVGQHDRVLHRSGR